MAHILCARKANLRDEFNDDNQLRWTMQADERCDALLAHQGDLK